MRALVLLILATVPLSGAITSIGTTAAMDKARRMQDRVAVPGHDDSQAWSSSIDIGASLTRGNSETLYITASVTVDHDFGKNEFFGNFTYAYGEESTKTTEDEFIVTASLSRLLTESGKTYFGGRLDGQHDDLADIDYRFTVSTFFGQYLIKRPDDSLQISIEAGLGGTVQDQGDVEDAYPVIYAGQRFNYWVTDFTRLYQGVAFFDQIGKFNSYQIIAEAGIETFLSDSLSFKAYAQSQYESIPAASREKYDLRLVSGLSYKF